MNQELLNRVNQEIYRRFPEVKGKRPKVQAQNTQRASGSSYLLVYHNQVKTEDQRLLTRNIRVVINETGKILKVTTSR